MEKVKVKYHSANKKGRTDGFDVFVTTKLQNEIRTIPLHCIYSKNSEGFQWGYRSAGLLDLAFSILIDYCERAGLDSDLAYVLCRDFSLDFIAPTDSDLAITGAQIESWLMQKLRVYKISCDLAEVGKEGRRTQDNSAVE